MAVPRLPDLLCPRRCFALVAERLHSINWAAWWIAIPLMLAETYSLIDSLLFGFTGWRLKKRSAPEPPPGLSVAPAGRAPEADLLRFVVGLRRLRGR